ncbi:hyccin-like isoform X2 [Syngnathus typhle]|uniref:hyccin-like isoform X2 n=1 Tax=Syngnathus typhle TaxID=161592 RepID=UPI002A6A7AA5|nr:hyccin-like isoform X2 [Syngnathus typhle]
MDDSEPAEDGLLAGLRWNRSARDQAQLKHKIRDLPGLLKHGLHLRKKSQSPDTIPGPSAGPTVNKSCSQSFPCAGRAVRNGFLSHGPYPAKDKIHLARIIRVCICGYPRQQIRRYKGISTRMTVTSEFLVQLLTGIHYALCNGEAELGSKALDDVLYRAQLELFPEALLVGNAIKSTQQGAALKSNTKEGARSIQVEITPTASRISRNAVTSLSIRGHRWKRHESQEVSVDSEAAPGGVAIPDISVTGVSSERMPNGESLRARSDGRTYPDGETLGGASDVSPEPRSHESSMRGQEVRRQKSVRRMLENESSGSASIGKSQH